MNSLPETVTRQRRGCDLNPGPSAPESSTLTTRLPSHPVQKANTTNWLEFADKRRIAKDIQTFSYNMHLTVVVLSLLPYRC